MIKCVFLIILFFYLKNSQAQRNNEIGFYIAPLKQSAYKNINSLKSEDDVKPSFSLSIEVGIFYKNKINSKFGMQYNVHFGILNHSFCTALPSLLNSGELINKITTDEASYSLGFTPNLIFKPFKKVHIVLGFSTKYFFDINVENNTIFYLPNGAQYEETLFARGTKINILPNENKWQFSIEVGLNYEINLAKNRILLKVNPFYQLSLNTVYAGVYRYTKGSYIEFGNFYNKVHQAGLRLLFGLTF